MHADAAASEDIDLPEHNHAPNPNQNLTVLKTPLHSSWRRTPEVARNNRWLLLELAGRNEQNVTTIFIKKQANPR